MTKDEALKLALEALKQIDEAMPFPVAKLAQAAIKEALAQPNFCPRCGKRLGTNDWDIHTCTPPQRKPLTDEEIDKAWRSCDYTVPWEQHRIDIARAIEAAHGIKGEA